MKKVKLFTTIASLCLAVALMAFGVYAASTLQSLQVGGNISFTATEADGYWSTLTVSVDGGKFTATGVTETASKTWNATKAGEEWANTDSLANVTDLAVVVDSNKTACTITISATFVNIGNANGVSVSVAKTDAALGAGVQVGTLGEGQKASDTAAANNGSATVTIIFEFSAVDKAQSQTNEAFGALFSAAMATN